LGKDEIPKIFSTDTEQGQDEGGSEGRGKE